MKPTLYSGNVPKKSAPILILATMFGSLVVAVAQDQSIEIIGGDNGEGNRIVVTSDNANVLLGAGGSFLGIVGDEVDSETVQKLGLPGEYGALIKEIVTDGAADRAGIRKNDVIVGYNGARVESMAQLRRLISETPAGRDVELEIIRDGSRQTLTAEMGTRKSMVINGGTVLPTTPNGLALQNLSNGSIVFGQAFPPMGIEGTMQFPNGFHWNTEEFLDEFREENEELYEEHREKMKELEKRLKELDLYISDSVVRFNGPNGSAAFFNGGGQASAQVFGGPQINAIPNAPNYFSSMMLSDGQRLGATVQSLSPQLAEYFKLEEGRQGALVSEVQKGMPAEQGGLKAGDIILRIDGEEVGGPLDVSRVLYSKSGTVELEVQRDGRSQSLKVNLGELEDQGYFRPNDRLDRRPFRSQGFDPFNGIWGGGNSDDPDQS